MVGRVEAEGSNAGRRAITLIRHAEPLVMPGTDPAAWPLSADGVRAARGLRPHLPDAASFVASTERKAVETLAHAIDREPDRDDRFDEVRRPGERFDDDVHARRRAWVEGALDARHAGWETPDEAASRFDDGVRARQGDLVVATLGMILTSWLVRIGRVAAGAEAGEFWARLRFPDLIDVDN